MNPTLKKIKQSILDSPEIKSPNNAARGYVVNVYYQERKCDIIYWKNDGTKMTKKRIDMPVEGDGVFKESLKPGDIIEISFKGKTQKGAYISAVQKKNRSKNDFNTDKGQELPLSTNLF